MRRSAPNARGVLLIEVAISLFVATLLAGLTALTIQRFSRAREHYAWRDAAAWAAQGQLERIRAGARLDSQPPAGTVPEGIALAVAATAGEGEWSRFRLVRVRASCNPRRSRAIVEEVAAYLVTESQP